MIFQAPKDQQLVMFILLLRDLVYCLNQSISIRPWPAAEHVQAKRRTQRTMADDC